MKQYTELSTAHAFTGTNTAHNYASLPSFSEVLVKSKLDYFNIKQSLVKTEILVMNQHAAHLK